MILLLLTTGMFILGEMMCQKIDLLLGKDRMDDCLWPIQQYYSHNRMIGGSL